MDSNFITVDVKHAAFQKAIRYLSMSSELSHKHAIELLTSETLSNFIPAQRSLAMHYLQLQDKDAALTVFNHLSELGDHIGHLRVACSLIQSQQNLERARELLELAVPAGNVAAKYYLAGMLVDGIGGPADAARGKQLLDEIEGVAFENL